MERDCSREATKTRRVHDLEDIGADVVNEALAIHREVGPGLLESVYETVLARRLLRLGYRVDRQKPIDITIGEDVFEAAFRCDLLVEERFLVEIKSVEQLHRSHKKQLLTYLRLMKLPLGLLMNFGAPTLKEGLCRLVNDHNSFASSRLRAHQKDN